jgi:hypothetical protein
VSGYEASQKQFFRPPHAQKLPVHPVHKMQKLVLLGRQGGKGRQGGSKESRVLMRILGYVAENKQFAKFGAGRIPPSPPLKHFIFNYLLSNPPIRSPLAKITKAL